MKTVLFLLLVSPLTLHAQKPGFLKYGVGFSYDKDLLLSNDPTARFNHSKWSVAEFLYDQYINDYLSIEGGIRDKFAQSEIWFYDTDTSHFTLAGNTVMFPLRVKARLKFLKKFLLTGGVGGSLLISHTFTGIDYSYTKPYQQFELIQDFPKSYVTLDLNAGLHYLISSSWKVTADFSISIHPKTIAEATMENTLRSTNSQITIKGSFYMVTVGIGYRLSNLWTKKIKNRGQNKMKLE